jgi:hypothetical protein
LNLSIKQHKPNCMHALLVIGADPTVRNNDDMDANDLALEAFGQTIASLRQESEVNSNTSTVTAIFVVK